MRQLTSIADPVYQVRQHTQLERFFLRYVKDERDLPFIQTSFAVGVTVVPLAIALFFVGGWLFWAMMGIFFVVQLYLMGPFILMLHNTSHNPFFKREYKWANRFIPWVLCPFMGQSPDTYFSHHIGMHHAENNLEHDKSSTMRFQRDSFWDFLRYFGRFLFIGMYELVEYCKFRGKKKFMRQAVIGEASYFGMCAILAYFNWQATVVAFVVPLVLVRLLMMMGNWAQHAFIDQSAPENSYLNSITCINSVYNRRCFNDGYHIGHHLRPHLHWTEMPKDFLQNKEKYAAHKSIVFEGIDYNQVWAMLMMGKYEALAGRMVNIENAYGSEEEVVRLLKARTRRFA